ncbi:hypothetical protein CR513_16327, partial [Mucuna pruriens]
MAAKVLISNSFEPDKGLGRRLDGIAEPVVIQESPNQSGLGYSGTVKRGKLGWKDQLVESAKWIHPTARELDNWTAEALPELINNMALTPDDAGKSNRQDEGEDMEEEALKELKRLLEQGNPKLQSGAEELEVINLGDGGEIREIQIGKLILPDLKQRLTKLLREYVNIFAWSYRDMPGLDTTIFEHRLPLILDVVPVQSQLRIMKLEVALKIKEEEEKQWNASFLAVAEYPQWVANIVLVPKKDGKVRMCIDYRDLNRASPKDNFSLPHIDLLVDITAQHSCYSFMIGFSGYNQIWMALEDKEKTTFITMWGTFCYKVMPFGLKNARATYQRAMVTLFCDMMHREVEVYVYDMISKS